MESIEVTYITNCRVVIGDALCRSFDISADTQLQVCGEKNVRSHLEQ